MPICLFCLLSRPVTGIDMNVEFFEEKTFYREVSENGSVWTIHKDAHILKMKASDGMWSTPYWSTHERAVRFINNVERYSDFLPMKIPIHVFLKVWLPDMKKDNRTLGINWTGATTIALEMTPDEVLSNEELLRKAKNPA
jgi:hypothetical protein